MPHQPNSSSRSLLELITCFLRIHDTLRALADVEKDAAAQVDMRSPFDQVVDLQKGSGSIPAALLPNMSEPIPMSPLSTRFTDEGLEACVSQHLATEAITLEWRVGAGCCCLWARKLPCMAHCADVELFDFPSSSACEMHSAGRSQQSDCLPCFNNSMHRSCCRPGAPHGSSEQQK